LSCSACTSLSCLHAARGGPLIGAPLATLVLATLASSSISFDPDVMKGDAAQILGTFGLALLLRYSVFLWFGANFNTLPSNLVGGTLTCSASASSLAAAGRRVAAGDARAASVADAHVTRIEDAGGVGDSTAAQLMGIRPDSMQRSPGRSRPRTGLPAR